MKKFLLLFLIILFPAYLFCQSGDGKTPGTAYYGTISTSKTWTYAYNNGVIYVGQTGNEDLTITTGGSLTIEAGVTVKFCKTASDLIISGTGALNATGTSSSPTRFTRNSQSTWGHISFEGSTGSSLLDNCIIEYGLKSGSGVEAYGGGIHINTSNLTVSNCKIHNNTAVFGGGIFVNQSVNPALDNCQIYSNTATSCGGGFYFWGNSYAMVTNCIVYNNLCSGSFGGGGILFGPFAGNVLFYNCIIASNSSTINLGNDIHFYGNTGADRPKLYNSIIWGNSSHSIDYGFYQTPSIDDFNYCAIQGYTSGYTSCINLNSSNSASDGPNFTDPTNGSYYISPWSPCVDIGLDHGSDSNVPLLDLIGKARIGQTDIGAYETWGYYWMGNSSSVWNSSNNWYANTVPSGDEDVYIPKGLTNYPVSSSAQNYTINTGRSMILAPGAQATFGTLTNSGTLKLESDVTNISSLIATTFSGNNATVQIYLSGGGNVDDNNFKWHYISSPVSSLAVSTFAPGTTLDVAQFIESRPALSLMQGWVAYDGYVYSTGLSNGPTFSALTPGKGFDFWDNADNMFTFSGALNTSDAAMSLGYSGIVSLSGFNLLGNPFSSGLNWDDIVNGTYFPYPANTSKGLYFTRDNAQCTYIGGVGTPGDVTGIIPPMQGFFTKTSSTGNTITLPAAARTHNGIHARYKGTTIIPLVRLSVTENSKSDETVVRFDPLAKTYLDNDYDAIKMFLSATTTSIYSSLSGTDYAINGQPFPDTFVEIPIVVNLTTSGNHTISAMQLQGLDNYKVTLTDKTTGFTADLKTTSSLSFSSDAGTIRNRLVLKVATIATGIENPSISKNTFNIYPANSFINIKTMSDDWDGKTGVVRILDLTGKVVGTLNNTEFSKDSNIQVTSPSVKGIYIVELKSGVMRYVGKVIIR